MKKVLMGTVLLSLWLLFGCNSGNDRTRKLQRDIAERDERIEQLESELHKAKKDNEKLRALPHGRRKIKWAKIRQHAKTMRKTDGKYECFYVVSEKTDTGSVEALSQTIMGKGYEVEPTPWEGVVGVRPPEKTVTRLVLLKKVNTVEKTRPLNDDNLDEIRSIEGVKSVWPQSVLFFPATVWLQVIGDWKAFEIDVKVIALPSEFFEEEKDHLDLEEFNRYDGYGAQAILSRKFIEHCGRFSRFSEGWSPEYEKALGEGKVYLKLDLASSMVFDMGTKSLPKDLKVVGITDRIKDLALIVKPEVVDDWNKLLFEKKE
jgi:outer membrane murein-binding lipoprotein Lpp